MTNCREYNEAPGNFKIINLRRFIFHMGHLSVFKVKRKTQQHLACSVQRQLFKGGLNGASVENLAKLIRKNLRWRLF